MALRLKGLIKEEEESVVPRRLGGRRASVSLLLRGVRSAEFIWVVMELDEGLPRAPLLSDFLSIPALAM